MFSLGDKILVKAVYEPNVTTVPVYFPGGREQLWYDIDTPLLYRGLRWIDVATNPNYVSLLKKKIKNNSSSIYSTLDSCLL